MSTATQSITSSVNTHDVAEAMRYLAATRDKLLDLVSGFSDAQWNFTPAADRWSIAESIEHLAIVEGRVHERMASLGQCPAAAADRADAEIDKMVLTATVDRSTKYQSPAVVAPSRQWPPDETLARFVELRSRTMQLLSESPFLRGHLLPHPVFGPLDGYQWVLACAAHSDRHSAQIQEVKSSPGFPAASY